MEVDLPKSVDHLARLITEELIKEIIYQLEICDPHTAGNLACQLSKALKGG